ncbi:protocatechuate 3,4-dioxygenase, alpha subunit [Faunimonas pinastri]|uniref:Protocatechuate 3,4-dioxygenase, alpha subunit n=1 Tax=Faunimonas pinastri TaxID=1855383 RepID=A0A1H9K6K2_9HYPH|nr:protocatechuate 3,4-dioxygenase subunit alpha [Faunimonas pinastri]SEQ94751.1 protocatechuate 3,4-dioxygenase, alpha subunit [Faunimonas pinastri]
MAEHEITPSQTVGPFFAYALTPTAYDFAALVSNNLLTDDAVGQAIRVEGTIYDGQGLPVPDAMVEIWQADGQGRFAGNDTAPLPNGAFKGFGRSECDKLGQYGFATVKPGPVPGPDGRQQAPHINVGIFARGIVRRLFTRIYFEDEAANGSDPILSLVPEELRPTLIARRTGDRDGAPIYAFDIYLQGELETVFFEA